MLEKRIKSSPTIWSIFLLIQNCQKGSWKVGKLESWKVGKLESWKVGKLESWKVGKLEFEKH